MNKKCIFIATGWWGRGAPISVHFRALAEELARRGHHVIMIVAGQGRRVVDTAANPAVYVWPSRYATRLRDGIFLARLIFKYRPECLIANFEAVNWMMVLGWLRKVPSRIAWYHTLTEQVDLDFKGPRWNLKARRLRRRLVYGLATHIVAPSIAARNDVQNVFNIPGNKCSVLGNSSPDSAKFVHSFQNLNGQNTVICVGRLDNSKGQDTVIRAAALLKNDLPDFRIDLIGAGVAEAKYRKLAEELDVTDVCSFVGGLQHDQVLRRISEARVSLVPSQIDNFPFVAIESLSCGTPVIASNTGGIGEVLRDGIDGFLIPKKDPVELAKRIKQVFSDPHLRSELGKNARRRFLDQFAQSVVIPKQADWLEEEFSRRST